MYLALVLMVFIEASPELLEKQPNIIYILSDDLGHADVGFTNGNTKTPNLNKLAGEGWCTCCNKLFCFDIYCCQLNNNR